MKHEMTWVGTGGGPLIVVPAELASHWRGGDGVGVSPGDLDRWWENPDLTGSDYGRACGIKDYLGSLDVGPGRALILNDEPMPTAFLRKPGGGILVRWMYAEDEGEVRRAIRSIPESIWEATHHSIVVAREGVLVFDSAYPGDDLPVSSGEEATVPWLRLGLPPGTYHVDTADHSPDESTRLILHRLRMGRGVRAGPAVARDPGAQEPKWPDQVPPDRSRPRPPRRNTGGAIISDAPFARSSGERRRRLTRCVRPARLVGGNKAGVVHLQG